MNKRLKAKTKREIQEDEWIEKWYQGVLKTHELYMQLLKEKGFIKSSNGKQITMMDIRQMQADYLRLKAVEFDSDGKSYDNLHTDNRKLVITKLNPLTGILRLYWRVQTALSDTTDVFWTDCGRDGNATAQDELQALISFYGIETRDIIDLR